jgi:two-component system KDP operon response regulator KdpE
VSENAAPAIAGPLVLVVDDERPIRRFLRAGLEAQGYRVFDVATGADALAQAATRAPDLVLLDLGLPDVDGIEVVRRIREWSRVPVIVLSARGQDADKIRALDAGADDYVTKPFSMGELHARMRVALRHATETGSGESPAAFGAGNLVVDFAHRRVTLEGREVRLTPIEFRLLSMLARHAGRVLTHEQLLREVWGPGYATRHHYLRVYMAQLRHKLERDPSRPRHLVTETGVGYRMRED